MGKLLAILAIGILTLGGCNENGTEASIDASADAAVVVEAGTTDATVPGDSDPSVDIGSTGVEGGPGDAQEASGDSSDGGANAGG